MAQEVDTDILSRLGEAEDAQGWLVSRKFRARGLHAQLQRLRGNVRLSFLSRQGRCGTVHGRLATVGRRYRNVQANISTLLRTSESDGCLHFSARHRSWLYRFDVPQACEVCGRAEAPPWRHHDSISRSLPVRAGF